MCWFVSFKDNAEEKKCFVLHFDVRRSDIYVYFRFVDYVPKIEKFSWLNRNKSIYIHYKDYAESQVIHFIREYLANIQNDFETDQLNCKKRIPCKGI